MNALDPAGRTPLHFAAGFGRVACVKFLLEREGEVRGERFMVQGARGLGVTIETRGGGEADENKSHRDNLEIGGRGQVSPLRTYHEYCYDLTTEEVEERLEETGKPRWSNTKR